MQCYIYKSLKKAELYLYVDKKDDFSAVPEDCLATLGPLAHVMDLELTHDRKLAREDSQKVIKSLREKGFFIQIPPPLVPVSTRIQ